MRRTKYAATVYVFLAVILIFLFSIGMRLAVRQILVKRMGISNALTAAVLFDAQGMNDVPSVIENWAEIYPFNDDDEEMSKAGAVDNKNVSVVGQYTELIDSTETGIIAYSTDHLAGYHYLVEAGSTYERLLQWNYSPLNEYNNVVFLEDGYLTNTIGYCDPTECAGATIELADYCSSRGIDFFYVMTPSKICMTEDAEIAGYTDFSNQVADDFLALLDEAGVDYMDTRALLHADGLGHHAAFYKTDHHWKAETGLWAAQKMLEKLSEDYGYDVDAAVLDPDRFRYEVYEDWILGSLGKKVTLARSELEDITLIYPKYETQLHFEVPSLGIDETGDFSITYDYSKIEPGDYYAYDKYWVYNHGDRPVHFIENKRIQEDESKVLIIHNSFADCVIPFLGLGIKYVEALDIRQFDGSVHKFIEETKPDTVIVLYCPDSVHDINWESHTDMFDFR